MSRITDSREISTLIATDVRARLLRSGFSVEIWHNRMIDNRLITTSNVIALTEGNVKRRNRLGGMLRFYYRETA